MKPVEYAKELLKDMPDFETDIEKAKYLYIKLGQELNFNPNYLYGNQKDRKEILQKARECHFEEIIDSKTIICIESAALYARLLNEIGIRAFLSQRQGRDPHIFTNVILDNKRIIKADLQQDLMRIKMGMELLEFGSFDDGYPTNDLISPEENRDVDKKIGYLTENGYTDKKIDEFVKSIPKTENYTEGLEYILETLPQKFDLRKLKMVEAKLFYKQTLRYWHNERTEGSYSRTTSESAKSRFQTAYLEKSGVKKHIQLLTTDSPKPKVYLMGRDNKFRHLSLENLEKAVYQGGLKINNQKRQIFGIGDRPQKKSLMEKIREKLNEPYDIDYFEI